MAPRVDGARVPRAVPPAFIAQIWKWWDPAVAWDTLNAVIQTRCGDRLQHFSSEFARSHLTQPPLIAWSLARLREAVGESLHRTWVEAAYEPLVAYDRWLVARRRLPHGLYAWARAYESCVENSPRFGTREERRLRDTRATAVPDFSAYVALQGEALAQMAAQLGQVHDADCHLRARPAVCAAINAHLWCGEQGLYFDREEGGALLRSRTVPSLLPLWAGASDVGRAARAIVMVKSFRRS